MRTVSDMKGFPILWCFLLAGASILPHASAEYDDPDTLNDIATTPERVAVAGGFRSQSGHLLDSANGASWYIQPSPTQKGLWGICYGAGRFLAVGYDGIVVTSENGKDWQVASVISGERWLMDVIYAEGKFIACGLEGIYLSKNGEEWVTVHRNSNCYGLTFGGGQFVAVGYGGRIFTSPNGMEWTRQKNANPFMLRSVAYGHGLYIAVGGEGRHGMLISEDGVHWKPASSGSRTQLMEIVFHHGLFVVVGGQSNPDTSTGDVAMIETSNDGLNWTTHFWKQHPPLNTAAYWNNQLMVAGDGFVGILSSDKTNLQITEFSYAQERNLLPAQNESALANPNTIKFDISHANGQVNLSWQTEPGAIYRLKQSVNLKKWQDAGVVWKGEGQVLQHQIDLPPGATRMFFRLEINR